MSEDQHGGQERDHQEQVGDEASAGHPGTLTSPVVAKYSTERLTDEAETLRLTVLWLIESHLPAPITPCMDCGHDLTDHDPDDSNCLFPRLRQLGEERRRGPFVLCRCSAFS